MIDTKELRRLTQAALIGPDGVSLNWLKLLQDFQREASPAAISELLDRLEAAEKERDNYKFAFIEYSEKTEWVQRGVNDGTVSAKYLGWHRADVMSDLLSAAEKERDALRATLRHEADCVEAAKAEIEALRAKIEAMEKQEPVGEIHRANATGNCVHSEVWVPLPVGTKLYALPGVKGE